MCDGAGRRGSTGGEREKGSGPPAGICRPFAIAPSDCSPLATGENCPLDTTSACRAGGLKTLAFEVLAGETLHVEVNARDPQVNA